MEDKLEILMRRQKQMVEELNNIKIKDLKPEEWQALFNKFVLAMHEETTELLKCTNYKDHREEQILFRRSNAILEIVDVFKYLFSIAALLNIKPEEFYQFEEEKSHVVYQRWNQKKILNQKSPVVMVDIDGVLADYPKSFYNYVNEQLGTTFNPEDQKSYDLCREFGISRKLYEELKAKYRETGYKRNIPTIKGSIQALTMLRVRGYKVVLFTARPVHEFSRIELDTLYWLRSNNYRFDGIIYAENKHEQLANFYRNNKVDFFFEDNESNAGYLAGDGIKVILFDKPYHKGITHENITRIKNWDEAREVIEQWKEKQNS